MPTVSTFATLLQILMAVYRLVIVVWNAPVVFVNVIWSAMEEAKQEAAELTALLGSNTSTVDMVRSSLGHETSHPENPWQMLIIARSSSLVLLLRLSQHRVLHLEVDEKFIMSRLEVIRTELMLHIEHIPRLLCLPIGTHDTRLVKYTPMKPPYLWREASQVTNEAAAVSVSCVSEVRAHRKKYVRLLAESALRRRMQMNQLGLEVAPKKGMSEKASKKRALGNATNTAATSPDERTDETCGAEAGVAPKVRMERGMHRAHGENNVNHAEQLRHVASQSLRRKRGQFDLYAPGVSRDFSLLPRN